MILTERTYQLTETFEDLEIKAFKSYDLELQADRLTVEFYVFQHKLAFLRHVFHAGKINAKQRDELLNIVEKWIKDTEYQTDKAEIIKITRPARQLFLSLITLEK